MEGQHPQVYRGQCLQQEKKELFILAGRNVNVLYSEYVIIATMPYNKRLTFYNVIKTYLKL